MDAYWPGSRPLCSTPEVVYSDDENKAAVYPAHEHVLLCIVRYLANNLCLVADQK